jgi:DNA polymerase
MLVRAVRQQDELGLGGIRVARESVVMEKQVAVSAPVAPATGDLQGFCEQIKDCTKCRLHQGRNKFVFGVGNPQAVVMFVGEGPGRDEDLKGEPFVGRAGQLLDKILAAIQFDRTKVYIANIVKCRPPNNRDPQPDEMAECMPYLKRQIELVNPQLICCLGRISAQALLGVQTPLGKMRQRWFEFEGRKLMVTYHPAALLRFPQYKRDTWEDVQMLRREYDAIVGTAGS